MSEGGTGPLLTMSALRVRSGHTLLIWNFWSGPIHLRPVGYTLRFDTIATGRAANLRPLFRPLRQPPLSALYGPIRPRRRKTAPSCMPTTVQTCSSNGAPNGTNGTRTAPWPMHDRLSICHTVAGVSLPM